MAKVVGILGQSAPSATIEDDLYTVPSDKNATVRVICCNRGGATTVRVSVGVNGAATANDQYIAYNVELLANDTLTTTVFTIGDTDVVRVYAGSSNVSFTCTGFEEDD